MWVDGMDRKGAGGHGQRKDVSVGTGRGGADGEGKSDGDENKEDM